MIFNVFDKMGAGSKDPDRIRNYKLRILNTDPPNPDTQHWPLSWRIPFIC